MVNGMREITGKGKLFFMVLMAVISLLCLLPEYTDAEKGKKVSVAAFGALPGDGQNDAGPLRKAMEYCRSNPGITLYFPPGIYNFSDRKAIELMDGIVTGKVRGNPQDSIFRPYYPYVRGVSGADDVTVRYNEVTGCKTPLDIRFSKNVRVYSNTGIADLKGELR